MTASQKATLRVLILLALLTIIFLVAGRQIFALMDLSIKDMKPFRYKDGPAAKKKAAWYNWITPMAKVIGARYGIPWQAIAVQTALETGWGSSGLFSGYNNFGGEKDTDGINTTSMSTTEYINGKKVTIKDGFETYKSPYEGLVGYAKFFHKNPRYKAALRYPNDPFQFVVEIKKAGYATDPNYVSKLHGMLRTDLKVKE